MRIDLPAELTDSAALAGLLGAVPRTVLPKITGIATDSREVERGDLFVALTGASVDGADFLFKARERGAVAALVRAGIAEEDLPLLAVDDPTEALLRAASLYRKLVGDHVIAVSGSTGKTTVKEALATVLSVKDVTEKSKGNFNSLVGMPLSVLSMGRARHWVLELGINHTGEMKKLSDSLAPCLAVLTNVGTAHIGNFGTFPALLAEKAEIASGLSEGGDLLIPAALPSEAFRDALGSVWRTGREGDFYLENIRYGEKGTTGDLVTPDRVITNLAWPILGCVGVSTIETVGAAAFLAGADEQTIREGLRQAGRQTPRLKRSFACGRILIDDSYNASPEATVNALENLVLIAKGCPTVAVLGDMLELGKYSQMLHRTVGNAVARSGIDMLYTYGKGALSIAEGAREAGFSPAAIYSFGEDEILPLADAVCRFSPENAAVLIKASGRMGLSRVVEEIKRRWSDE